MRLNSTRFSSTQSKPAFGTDGKVETISEFRNLQLGNTISVESMEQGKKTLNKGKITSTTIIPIKYGEIAYNTVCRIVTEGSQKTKNAFLSFDRNGQLIEQFKDRIKL